MESKQNPLTNNTDDYSSSSSSNYGSWSSETTWVIASGSLEDSITFDSSDDSPVESDSPGKSTSLVLKPPSPDSGPCEIKLHFSQKYSIRQIYVRSTARVYEIYHSKSQYSGTEYLCTARCCIAERDEQVLQFSEGSPEDTAPELGGEKLNGEEISATSEDDWVDVKVLDTPLCENSARSLSNTTNSNTRGQIQDYYEATVEMSDSEPCTSVNIRLLSLQNKDCVSVDEVYAFAELVDPIHSGNPAPQVTGSAGSSLMAMLFPTLLQLSKSGISPIQAEQVSDKVGKANKVEISSKPTDLTDVAPEIPQDEKSNTDQQYVKLPDLNGSTNESTNNQLPTQNLTGDRSHDPVANSYSPYGHITEVLEQLVSRVSKIEEVCLRFEENMLKPINSMELRIQRVEEQLESLAKSSHYSGLPSGTRISAPSFSWDSNSSSFHNDGSDSRPFRGADSERKEYTSVALSNPSDAMPDSANAPCFLPSLVVTAPEFSCIEDEQEDDVLESLKGNNQNADLSKTLKDSPEGKPKIRSLDDVLAAALANFLLSPSDHGSEFEQTSVNGYGISQIIGNEMSSHIQALSSRGHDVTVSVNAYEEPPKYTQILTVTAPEFTSEETGGEEDPDFTQLSSAEASGFATWKTGENCHAPLSITENGLFPITSDSSHCDENKSACDQLSMTEDLVPIILSSAKKDDCSFEANVQSQFFEESTTRSFLGSRSASSTADQAKDSVTIDFCQTTEEAGQSDCSILSSPKKKDVLVQIFGYNIDVSSNMTRKAAAAEEPRKDIVRNASESPTAALVNLLDIKFNSRENSSTQSSLEALLGDLPLPELNLEANSLSKNGVDFDCGETNFVDMDGNELIDPLTCKRLLVDLGIYDMVSSDEERGLDNHYTASNHEMAASLI